MRDFMKVCIDKRNFVCNCIFNVNVSLLLFDFELGLYLKYFLRYEYEFIKFICFFLELLVDLVICNI